MGRTKTIPFRTEPEMAQQMADRAQDLGVSLNEWLNRVTAHALASKGITVKYTTEVEI
jgi:predicted HicB family RNase H-like nuclease